VKEVKTKDEVVIKYVKNTEKSINGVCNVFDVYDKDGKFLGNRVGVRDLKTVTYESLFDSGGNMIYDPNNKLGGNIRKKSVRTGKDKVNTNTLTQIKNSPGVTSSNKTPEGKFETSLKFRITLRTKRKITVDDIIKYLEEKYEIWGYDIEAETKEINGENLGGNVNVLGEEKQSTFTTEKTK